MGTVGVEFCRRWYPDGRSEVWLGSMEMQVEFELGVVEDIMEILRGSILPN